MKNVKFRGKKTNSVENSVAQLVKTQIPQLGSKFHGPRKTGGPAHDKYNWAFVTHHIKSRRLSAMLIY